MDKHRARLEVIDRVWKADPEFMADYAEEVLELEGDIHLQMARAALVAGDRVRAREALVAWKSGPVRHRRALGALLSVAAAVPGVAAGLRSAKRWFG